MQFARTYQSLYYKSNKKQQEGYRLWNIDASLQCGRLAGVKQNMR